MRKSDIRSAKLFQVKELTVYINTLCIHWLFEDSIECNVLGAWNFIERSLKLLQLLLLLAYTRFSNEKEKYTLALTYTEIFCAFEKPFGSRKHFLGMRESEFVFGFRKINITITLSRMGF